MSGHRSFSELRAKIESDPERKVRSDAYARAMRDAIRLEELRTQKELNQASISSIEHEEDLYLSTLRGYVEELGGELEVSAVFPEGKILLTAKGS